MTFNLVVITLAAFVVCTATAQLALSLPGDLLNVKLLGNKAEQQGDLSPSPSINQPQTVEEEKTVRRRRETNEELPIPETQPEDPKPVFKADKIEEIIPVRVRRQAIDDQEDDVKIKINVPELTKEPQPSAPVA